LSAVAFAAFAISGQTGMMESKYPKHWTAIAAIRWRLRFLAGHARRSGELAFGHVSDFRLDSRRYQIGKQHKRAKHNEVIALPTYVPSERDFSLFS
jgi:hypothetical protein